MKYLVGKRFGKLRVVDLAHAAQGRAHWLCQCECGNRVVVASNNLQRAGGTKSCGCLRIGHGYARPGRIHPLYRIWLSMRERCNNPLCKSYCNYGARGIAVCAAWDDFPTFLRDMGPRPSGTSLERKDNNGPYSPDNCYWATPAEQARNTRRTRWLVHGEQRRTLSEWARHFGVTPKCVHWYCATYGDEHGLQKLAARGAL